MFADRYLEINAQAREQDRTIGPLSDEAALGVVGAILELVAQVEEGRTADFAELTEPLSEFVFRNVLATAK